LRSNAPIASPSTRYLRNLIRPQSPAPRLRRCISRGCTTAGKSRSRYCVAEFAKHLDAELDLMREAANASQLHRNFENSPLLLVPEIHWDYCSTEVMV